jgi:hypothetical protein
MIAIAEYPAPGTLGSTLYEVPREELERRLSPVRPHRFDDRPVDVDLGTVRRFLEIHSEMLEAMPTHGAAREFRLVPSARHFGRLMWLSPEERAAVDAYFPPFEDRAASTLVAFTAASEDELARRLEELGFPAPDRSPTIVVGETDRAEGRTSIYVPGPPSLSELVYRVRRLASGGLVAAVSSERPPEPRYTELVESYRRAFGWEGTMYFETGRAFARREGRLVMADDERVSVLGAS